MLLAIVANDVTCAAEVRQAARLTMKRTRAGSSLAPRANNLFGYAIEVVREFYMHALEVL